MAEKKKLAERGHSRDGFLLRILRLRSRSVQHLEEVGSLGAHSRMNINLTALDVIVQIVSEHVYQIDGVVARLPIGVTWEQHCEMKLCISKDDKNIFTSKKKENFFTERDVADAITHGGLGVLQLQRRLAMVEQHLRSGMARPSALFQFLQEQFANNHVVLIFEYCAEYYSDPVALCFHVP